MDVCVALPHPENFEQETELSIASAACTPCRIGRASDYLRDAMVLGINHEATTRLSFQRERHSRGKWMLIKKIIIKHY